MAATRKSTRGLRLSEVGPAGDSRLPGRMKGSWVCGYGGISSTIVREPERLRASMIVLGAVFIDRLKTCFRLDLAAVPTVISRTLVLNIVAVCSEAFASFSSSTHDQTSTTKLSIGLSVSILSRTTYHRSLFVSYLCLAPIARADSAALASLLSVTAYVSPPTP